MLSFAAEDVETDVTEYTRDCTVYLIAFGTGDPEREGHALTFEREFDEDAGVCTVRDVQRATIYEGIASFELSRNGLVCKFDAHGESKVGLSEVRIAYRLDDQAWKELADIAQIVFRDRDYFQCQGNPNSSIR